MLEKVIEVYVKKTLESKGFLVLKLTTPGFQGVMDRMILFPRYSPRPPEFVEIKRDSKDSKLSPVQVRLHRDFASRGVMVHPPIWTIEQARAFCSLMLDRVEADYIKAKGDR